MIAAYWADVDTRGGTVTTSAGGTSTGSDLLWYDLDAENHIFTATWDDVGYYSYKTDKLNAFQLRLIEVADSEGHYTGDFNIEFRYEQVEWTTGGASGGTGGLGGTPARAGYTSGNGVNYFELPQSGNQAALLALESASNIGDPGRFLFEVRGGSAEVTAYVNDVSQVEGNGAPNGYAVIPVFLSAPSATAVTLSYALENGTALAGADYVVQRGVLTFAPGVTQQNVYVELVGDRVVEPDETFTLRLTGSSGARISDATGVVTIVNDDGLSIGDVIQAEGTGEDTTTFTFTVNLLTASTTPVSVDYATAAGTAAAGSDFEAVSGRLQFAAGETSKTVTVEVAADALVEADETFRVVLSNASGAAIARDTGTATIVNDDGLVIDDARVVEGTGSGTTMASVVVRLLSPAEEDVTVAWQTLAGTATATTDFTPQSGRVTIAAGDDRATISVPVVRDSLVEGNETFRVQLSSPTGTTLVDNEATVTIVDDDGFSVSDATVVEGTGGTRTLQFTVSLSSALAAPSSVAYATVDGTATAGSDYTATSGTLTFAAGQTSQVVSVAIATDAIGEANETFGLRLSNPSANSGIADASGLATIINDDGLSVSDVRITEGNSGTTNATVTVSLSGASATPVTVHWETMDGTAAGGVDYVAAEGDLTFAAGETSRTITVAINGDTIYEPDESFRIALSNPVNSAIVDGSGTIVIANDDSRPAPALSITDASITEGTGAGTTVMRFVVGLSYASSSAVTVQYATADGTAAFGSDYTGTTGTLTIPAGSLYGIIEVPVLRDALIEADETFSLTLLSPTGGATIGTASATGTILNDDALLSISAASAVKAEGHSGSTPFTFTVTRSGDTSVAHSAAWSVAGTGTNAATAADFTGGTLPRGTVSFAAGETSKTITVNVAGDRAVEAAETFAVSLSGASTGASFGTSSAVGTIRNDDALLSISAASASKAEGHSGSTPFTFTVTRSGDTSVAHSAAWSVAGTGTNAATASDFTGGTLPRGTVSFAAGETSKTITVNVAGDRAVEAAETFAVSLSGASTGASFGTSSAVGTILNDDTAAGTRISISPVSATSAVKAEGHSGSTPFTFLLTRVGDTSGANSVTWAVAGSGANPAAASDFTGNALPRGVVTFAAGETSKILTVNIAGDRLVEASEGFSVALSGATGGATIGTSLVSGTILNDDALLSISAASASKAEGHSGSTPFTFTVTRSGDTSVAHSAAWAVTGTGTSAASASDFTGGTLPSGTVSFAAGETSKTITVSVAGDRTVEAAETFAVSLSGASAGASFGTSSAVGTILNDDAVLSVRGPSAPVLEGNSGSTPITFTVTRTGDTSTAASAAWSLAGSGTAPASASDFTGGVAPSGTVSFAAGETTKTITVRVAGDLLLEPDESFILRLSSPTNAVLGTATATAIIANDDTRAILGTDGPDTLRGTSGNDDIRGLPGNDTIDGLAGDDTVQAGDGNDRIIASGGNDSLIGGAGDDTYVITGAPGIVSIEDAVGTDTIDASAVGTGFLLDLRPGATSTVGGTTVKLVSSGTTTQPLDVVFLQDLSGSFSDDLATVRTVAPQVATAVRAVQADSRFGVSAFIDKPKSPFGVSGDYVYRTVLGLTADATQLTTTYNGLTIGNGNDGPEAQLEALMQLGLRTGEVGFRTDSLRVAVLFTDASFHKAGDGATAGITTPNDGDTVLEGTPAGTGEDYPAIAQAAAALAAAGVYTVFAVTADVVSTYATLAAQLGNATVVTLSSNSSNIVAAVTAGLGTATQTLIENAVGGAGNDTLIGNTANNILTGNAGDDSLVGGSGHDTLLGGAGNDRLSGDAGDDVLIGGAGNDFLAGGDGTDTANYSDATAGVRVSLALTTGQATGGSGTDTLSGIENLVGTAFNDSLTGDSGANQLTGGKGADQLTGGGGADTFVYSAVTDSTLALAGRDQILDFSRAQGDKIDVSAIDADPTVAGDQAFVIVAGDFTGGARELSIATWGTSNLLRFDLDRDGVADLAITVISTTPITAADLIL